MINVKIIEESIPSQYCIDCKFNNLSAQNNKRVNSKLNTARPNLTPMFTNQGDIQKN